MRLSTVAVRQYQRRTSRGRVVSVRQSQQTRASGASAPYLASWGSLRTGDVIRFPSGLWKVIPYASFPGNKASSTSTAKGTGSSTGGSTTGVSTGTSTSSGTGSSTGGSTTGTGTNITTQYLQNVTTGKFSQLDLPKDRMVTVVPMV